MTRKQPLYAFTAALLLVPQMAAAQPPAAASPCAACVHLASRAADWDPGHAADVALVLRTGDVGDDGSDIGTSGAAVKSARTILLEVDGSAAPDELSFVARRALTGLRAANPTARLGVIASRAAAARLLSRGLAAYADVVVVPDLTTGTAAGWKHQHPGLQIWSPVQAISFDALLDASASAPDAADARLVWPPGRVTRETVADLRTLRDLFPADLVPLPDPVARCEPRQACTVEAYQRADTLATIVVARRTGRDPAPLALSAPRGEAFAIASSAAVGPLPDRPVPIVPPVTDASGRMQVRFPGPEVIALVIRIPSAGARVTEEVSVVGARQLSVEEIIARHQAVAARQSQMVRSLISHARTTVTFEVPAFPAPVTVQADTTAFQGEGPTELVQRNLRVNGVAYTSSQVPRLPLIEPERVAAPPLAITLGRAYRYRLAGRDSASGRACYVVAFEPAAGGQTLFQGRAWIDMETFALVRVDAVQTSLRGAITSSQQIEDFAPAVVGTESVSLLARSEIRQVYQGAGLTTPIHRLMIVERHEINPPDLQERRTAAYASSAIMLRETREGLRYLQRTPARNTGTPAGVVREVAGRATRIRTLAGGVIVDPNITRPLPFAGLNYTDFDLFGTGTQFNAFLGGAYGQFAFNAPSLWGSRWQLTGSGFGILARYNDRSFVEGRERYGANIEQRPAHLRAGVVRPLTARTTAKVEYLFDYVAFRASHSTETSFIVPADQVVHGARLALETQRAGWKLEAWWNPARRAGWRPWGTQRAAEYDPARIDFQRYGVSAYRPWVFTPRLLARVDAAWMSGRDLDRFSRYAFGTFENRLRGYPSASIRYDRGGAVRTALVWQTGGRVRLDGFFDAALVSDPGFGAGYRAYPGIGAAVEAPGPLGLLLGGEWGYGVRGLNASGRRGTHVVRLTAYKVF